MLSETLKYLFLLFDEGMSMIYVELTKTILSIR